jgi:hypothetical protein
VGGLINLCIFFRGSQYRKFRETLSWGSVLSSVARSEGTVYKECPCIMLYVPSTVWCSRERLPAAAAQPAKVRQSCSATDLFIYLMLYVSEVSCSADGVCIIVNNPLYTRDIQFWFIDK